MISVVKLTVFFDNPFWIGVFEISENGEYKVCKFTFGAEPKDEETYQLILKNFYHLNFGTSFFSDEFNPLEKKPNPKRLQRSIKKEVNAKGIGTKAQIAMQLQHEQNKVIRKQKSKEQKEQEDQRKFELRKKKKLEKHKGH